MSRAKKIVFGGGLALLVGAGLLHLLGYYLTREFRESEAILQPLLATNAPLTNVMAHAGFFTVTRRNTPEWTQMVARYTSGSKWDKHIAKEMEHAAAIGHNSTISMQTWIFLDAKDRLIGFKLGTQ